jgi:hypothetical protein
MVIQKDSDSGKVLYVHPQTTMSRQCIMPFSIPAMVKRIPYAVDGRFAGELTDQEIRDARIIFMDIHWYLALHGAELLCKRIKTVNPNCVTIAGGITASEYPYQIISKFGVDFVIRGDGERPLPELVTAIMEGTSDFENIPNLIGKNGVDNPRRYVLNSADMEENDYLDIDFFPSFKKEIYRIQKNNVSPWSEVIHPYMIPFRGCPIECVGCAGAISEQRKLFGRKPVMRSAERLREDFERCDREEGIRFVSIYHDFITLLKSDYAFDVLTRPLNLNVRMEFNSRPEMDQLRLILNTFRGGVINFSIDHKHLTSSDLIDPDHMVALIKEVKKHRSFFTVLSYNKIFARNNPAYKEGMAWIVKATGCLVSDESFYWTEHPIPDKNGLADEDMFDMHLELSKDRKFMKGPMVKMYDSLEPLIPRNLSLGIRKTQQWMVQNVPYYVSNLQ